MAITEADINEMLAFLVTHPEYQERFRTVTAAPELSAIPSRMDRVEAALERLVVAGAATDARIDRLAARMDRIEAIVEKLSNDVTELSEQVGLLVQVTNRIGGDLGNLKGKVLETHYSLNVDNWIGEYVDDPVKVAIRRLPGLKEALAAGRLSAEEHRSLRALDLLVRGNNPESGDVVMVAVEVSAIVDGSDVRRARSRAAILEKLGFNAIAVVGGYGATLSATEDARVQGVIIDLHPDA